MTCKEHSGLVVTLKNIEEKLDEQINHCKKTTCDTNKKINSIEINVASLNSKVDWLVLDRQEQRDRYEKKRAWIKKIQLATATTVIGFFGYLFKEREAVRLFLKEWLQ